MRSSRLAWIAAALAAACGEAAKPLPGPVDSVYMPTGLAVHRAGGEARLIVASSNADLRYDDTTGGAVLSIDPEGVGATLGVNIRSFAGELALATTALPGPADPDPSACGTAVPGTLAIVATRGSDTLNAVLVEDTGLSCYRCGVPLAGSRFGDPFPVAVACRNAEDVELRRARAFVGHLRSFLGEAWISEYTFNPDREEPVRTALIGSGPIRSLTYDAARDRLYVLGLATGAPTPLRWIDLVDCELGAPAGRTCTVGSTTFPGLPAGLELRSMALGHPVTDAPRRAFLTARVYDPVAAAVAGGRTSDLGGLLIVVDLVDNALGGIDAEVVWTEGIGRGAQDVRVLPRRPGLRDVAVALSVDDGSLWIYDDESRSIARLGRLDALGGRPELGAEPFGLAVDPEATTTARVYVGSFRESFVTPVDVPLANPDAAVVVSTAGAPRRITGRTP